MRNIYIAMKRIVHKEQSQRRVPENSWLAVKQWWKDSVRELWNRPRSSVQLKYGVFLRYRKKREQCAGIWAQC